LIRAQEETNGARGRPHVDEKGAIKSLYAPWEGEKRIGRGRAPEERKARSPGWRENRPVQCKGTYMNGFWVGGDKGEGGLHKAEGSRQTGREVVVISTGCTFKRRSSAIQSRISAPTPTNENPPEQSKNKPRNRH